MAGRLDRVCNHEDGLAVLVDFAKQAQKAVCGTAVQRTGGLVRQNELGPGDEGAGDGGALFLAAADFVGEFGEDAADAQLLGDGAGRFSISR